MRTMGIMAAFAVLAGCAGDPDLVRPRSSQAGPDEFAVVPNRPLETPPSLDALPAPTPGGTNRGDQNPQADAVAALGGRPGAGVAGGSELIGYATRFGVEPGIRSDLAAEDRAFRQDRRSRVLERVFNVGTYFTVYAPQSLDKEEELLRLRRSGVRVPAAPPPGR